MIALLIALFTCICAGIAFVRFVKGPTVADHIAAANAIGIMLFAVLLLLSYTTEALEVLDVALVYAILQFADVLIMAKYLGCKDMEPTDAQ